MIIEDAVLTSTCGAVVPHVQCNNPVWLLVGIGIGIWVAVTVYVVIYLRRFTRETIECAEEPDDNN